jgi:HEAT repeat protein
MRCTGFLAVVTLIGLLATGGSLVAQGNKDPLKEKEKKEKEADPPSYIHGKTIQEWTAALKHPDPSVRQQAVQNIVAFGPHGRLAVPTLYSYSLKDQDVSLRCDAAAALGMLGAMDRGIEADDMPKVVQALGNLLGDTEYQQSVKLQAALALAQIGPKARAAVPLLEKNIRYTYSWQLRKAVCYALGRIGADPVKGPDPKALDLLLKSLKDPATPVRFEAILALSALGLSPNPQLVADEKKSLQMMLGDPDKNIAIWSRVLLMFLDEKNIGEKDLISLSGYLRKDNDPKVRCAAARAIGTLGPKAKTLVPELFTALGDKDLEVVLNSYSALGMMIDVAPNVLPQLQNAMLNDSEAAVRGHVAGVIANAGEPAKGAISAMTTALKDKESGVVYQVIVGLMRFGSAAAPAVPALQDLAKTHKDESIKHAASEAAKYIADQPPPKKKP